MGMLIDELLQFSRTGRTEMRQSYSDMNEIMQEALGSLHLDNSSRTIEWVIGELPSVSCDKAMLKLVWVNLLSNALKFTRTREHARIEIGVDAKNTELVFFVRDNGVGFDMQYAQKLFGVFQRLHSMEEFEGTGIGLANVRRIISRHEGRTWAEAEPDKGATFYFTLPNHKKEKP
jgi:light-regulated signal transduction histidine kinase (bacteriophytochrome)